MHLSMCPQDKECTAIGRWKQKNTRGGKLGVIQNLIHTRFPQGKWCMPSFPFGFGTDLRGMALGRLRLANRMRCLTDTASTETDPFCCCNCRVGTQSMLQLAHRCIDQRDSRRKSIDLETG